MQSNSLKNLLKNNVWGTIPTLCVYKVLVVILLSTVLSSSLSAQVDNHTVIRSQDTCISKQYIKDLQIHVGEVLHHQYLLIQEIETMNQAYSECNNLTMSYEKVIENEKAMRSLAEKNMVTFKMQADNLNRSLKKSKKRKWYFFAAGAAATLTTMIIIK